MGNTFQAQNQAKLLNVKQLNKLCMAKFMFKFKNKKLPKCFENFFKTRSEQQRYLLRSRVKEDYICEWGKSNYGMKRLQYEGVQLWNNHDYNTPRFSENNKNMIKILQVG